MCIHTKTLFKIVVPALSYTESLRKCGLERVDDRHDMITQSFSDKLKIQPRHPLHYLLPPVKVSHSQMVYISNSIGQNFTKWKGHRAVLHFQQVLVLMRSTSSCLGLFCIGVFDCCIGWICFACVVVVWLCGALYFNHCGCI